MSLKIFFPKSVKNSKSHYIHPNQIIKLRMEQEGKFIKAVSEMIQNPKHLNLKYITKKKPEPNKVRGIRDKSKLHLANELDLFRKSIYDIDQKHLKMKKGYIPFKENQKSFIEKYGIFKKHIEKKVLNDMELLGELRYNLNKKYINISLLDSNKNLFKKNLLLQKKEQIADFLSYKVGTQNGNCKAFKYLSKLNETVSDKIKNRINISKYLENEGIKISKKNKSKINSYSFLDDKITKNKKNKSNFEIENTKDEMVDVEQTLKTLKNFDEFMNMDNQDYMELLNQKRREMPFNSEKNSIVSIPILNKSFSEFPKNSIDDISQTLAGKTTKNFPIRQSRKSFTLINKQNEIFKNINLNKSMYQINNGSNINKNSLFANCSGEVSKNMSDKSDTIKNLKLMIKIKKLNMNKIPRRKSTTSIDSRISTIYPSTSYDKFHIKTNKNIHNKRFSILSKSKSAFDFNNKNSEKEDVEMMYDTLKNSENSLIYDDMIKNYFKKKVDDLHKLNYTKFDIFQGYKKMSRTFYRKDFIDRNIRMKKDINSKLETIDKFKEYSSTTNLQVKKIKEKIDKVMDAISIINKEENVVLNDNNDNI